jgi:hypothetical protein
MLSLHRKAFFCLLLLAACCVPGRSFGQVPRFLPGLLPADGVFGLALSPDGQSVLAVASRGGRDTLQLLELRKKKGQWQAPSPPSFADPKAKDIDPFFTPDGSLLLFNSNRGQQNPRNFDIWAAPRTSGGWGQPYSLGPVVNSDSSDFYATAAKNGNLYFSSNRAGGAGQSDLYLSAWKNGAYTAPVNLGPVLNTKGHEANPFIAPDESYLIFFAQYEGGFGDTDLYISFRSDTGWTRPANLGPRVNTTLGEFCPLVSADGKGFYFSRLERKNGRIYENIHHLPLQDLQLPLLGTKEQADSTALWTADIMRPKDSLGTYLQSLALNWADFRTYARERGYVRSYRVLVAGAGSTAEVWLITEYVSVEKRKGIEALYGEYRRTHPAAP